MSTKYRFTVTPCGADLELEHNVVFPDTWVDKAASDKLIAGSGNVDSSHPGRLICHTGPDDNTPVITLMGAAWTSGVHATGSATCDLCKNTTDDQRWTLTSKG